MSNARSPREVCSTTIGINGLIASLLRRASWGPQLLLGCGRSLLLGSPEPLARGGELGRDRLHLGGDAIDGPPQTQVGAHAVGEPGGEELLDLLVALAALAQLAADVL